MSDRIFIGIDSGSQGTRVLAMSGETGNILAKAEAGHDMIQGSGGRREQKPAWWIKALRSSLAEVLGHPEVEPGLVRAIGVSGQQHGMVPLGKDGEVIRPAKLWCDTETASQCDEITRKAGGEEAVVDLVGNSIAAGYTASKILWMRQNEPEKYERLETVLLPHDYINFWLTGERATECGDASGTAYFDVRERKWSPEILTAIDPSGKLESCLPRIVESKDPVGTILPELAREFGLPEDVLVSSGGGDNMMAAIGTGNVVPGMVTASLGTSGTIFASSDNPVVDSGGELAAFCSSTGAWLPLVCTMNVTVATELFRNAMGMDLDYFNLAATKAPIGSGGLILVPYFNGERTPALPNATATLSGMTGMNFTRENLSRAAMEGATLGLRYGLEVMVALGVKPGEIRLVGGGSKSALWRKIVANVLGCPVVCPSKPEAAALGGAIQAAWCFGLDQGEGVALSELTDKYVRLDPNTRVEPRPVDIGAYEAVYQRYLRLGKAMLQTRQ